MAVPKLPDLTPERVVQLLDALLANADTLLTSALAVLNLGHVALARSLAILGMEESGKAIAVHERRVEMTSAPDGEPFRLGEHIEGKKQDEQEAGVSPAAGEDVASMKGNRWADPPPEIQEVITRLVESMKAGIPGEPLNNAAYCFNPPGADRSPFRNLGKPGYEAETRELIALKEELDRRDEERVAAVLLQVGCRLPRAHAWRE